MDGLRDILTFYKEIGVENLIVSDRESFAKESIALLNQKISVFFDKLRTCKDDSLVIGEGRIFSDFMFVSERPALNDLRFKRPFIDKSGAMLDKIIKKMGYERSDIYLTSLIKINESLVNGEVEKKFQKFLLQEIKAVSPKYVYALGNKVADFLSSEESCKIINETGCRVVSTVDLSSIISAGLKSRKEASELKWKIWSDIEKALIHIRAEN